MAGAGERRRERQEAAELRARQEAETEERRLREVGLDDPWRFRLPGLDYFPPVWYWLITALFAALLVVTVLYGEWWITFPLGVMLGVSLYRRRLLNVQRKKGNRRGQVW